MLSSCVDMFMSTRATGMYSFLLLLLTATLPGPTAGGQTGPTAGGQTGPTAGQTGPIAGEQTDTTDQYAVVIDAGSTGSRVTGLHFKKSESKKSLWLCKECPNLFHEEKPGLSSFVEDKAKAGEQIKRLLEKATTFVPAKDQGATPLIVRATAGLRMLNKEDSDKLLEEVQRVVRASPFSTNSDSVAIMEGAQEGLYQWISINLLSGKLFGDTNNMLATLDLGGASTQITFPLIDQERANIPSEDVHSMQIFNKELVVYTHSYLGLGLNAAREEIAKGSECAILKESSGTQTQHDTCSNNIKNLVSEHVKQKPKGLLKFEIAAASYFFDIAKEKKLIPETSYEEEVSLKKLKEKTSESCVLGATDGKPKCLELLFMTTLLEDGYGINPETKIKILKKIDGFEAAWSLGAAFHTLLNKPKVESPGLSGEGENH